jgi:hypothetical protein
VQADPIIQNPMRVQSLNRYSYVWNNPLNATDPNGFKCVNFQTSEEECIPTNEEKVTNGKDNCSSRKCQNYTYKDKNGDKHTISINKKDTEAFEKEMAPEMARGAYSNSASASGGGSGAKNLSQQAPKTQQSQNGGGSGAAQETGGIIIDSDNPFAGRAACGSDKACVQQNNDFQTNGTLIAIGFTPVAWELGVIKIASWIAKGKKAEEALDVANSTIQANKAAGDAARDVIAARTGGVIEQNFSVTGGLRRVDVLDGTTAIESKVGKVSLTPRVRQELARDVKLLRSGQVNHVQWEFSPSAITGKSGPTGPLRQKLEKFGINIVE